jgi:hypothetical protein
MPSGLQRHVALLVMPRLDIESGALVGPDVQAARRHDEIGWRDERHLVHVRRNGRAALNGIGQGLHADPGAAVAAGFPGAEPEGEQFLDGGGIEHRHAEMDQRDVALVGERRGTGAVVVAAQRDGAAVFGGALVGGVLQHVARAVHAWALAVPEAKHAIEFRLRQHADLLAAPYGGGGQVLVDARLEVDGIFVEVLLGAPKRQVVAAERRAAIAGDESGSVQPGGAVPADLQDGQAHQGLNAGEIHPAIEAGVFVVQRDGGRARGGAGNRLIQRRFLARDRRTGSFHGHSTLLARSYDGMPW